jgi:hypothetical protein
MLPGDRVTVGHDRCAMPWRMDRESPGAWQRKPRLAFQGRATRAYSSVGAPKQSRPLNWSYRCGTRARQVETGRATQRTDSAAVTGRGARTAVGTPKGARVAYSSAVIPNKTRPARLGWTAIRHLPVEILPVELSQSQLNGLSRGREHAQPERLAARLQGWRRGQDGMRVAGRARRGRRTVNGGRPPDRGGRQAVPGRGRYRRTGQACEA